MVLRHRYVIKSFVNRLSVAKCETVSSLGFVIAANDLRKRIAFSKPLDNKRPIIRTAMSYNGQQKLRRIEDFAL